MKEHIYIFGSICRGEYSRGSDIDMLAITEAHSGKYEREKFSIYTHERLEAMWAEGNPFAWHLKSESRIVYSSDGNDWIKSQGSPAPYTKARADCEKFADLYFRSCKELQEKTTSVVFELSCIFLSIRNFSTCFSLSKGEPCFSRNSPYLINKGFPMKKSSYLTLTSARILSTRGIGSSPSENDVDEVISEIETVGSWMKRILNEVPCE